MTFDDWKGRKSGKMLTTKDSCFWNSRGFAYLDDRVFYWSCFQMQDQWHATDLTFPSLLASSVIVTAARKSAVLLLVYL